jgi:bifunctional non-homologous end joining protein LigD
MTELLPELAELPPRLLLDGELIAFGQDRKPSFPLLCWRMLQRERSIPVMFVVFDLLAHHRRRRMGWPYWQRRRRLDKLNLSSPWWYAPEAFHDGESLFAFVQELCLEGIVAKKLSHPYTPGNDSGSRRRTGTIGAGRLSGKARSRSRSKLTI